MPYLNVSVVVRRIADDAIASFATELRDISVLDEDGKPASTPTVEVRSGRLALRPVRAQPVAWLMEEWRTEVPDCLFFDQLARGRGFATSIAPRRARSPTTTAGSP